MDNSDIFLRSGIDKQLKIYTDDKSISFTNSDLYFQEFQLEESICDEESIKFGYLQASSIQFKVANSFVQLKGKWLNVDFVLDKDDSNTYPVGKFKVAEDTPAADRRYRTVKCYDALYDVINSDVAAWYNALFPTDDTKVTMKTFRNSFFSYFGIEQVDLSLVNDAIVIEKTISPDELSGKVVLSAILELNGCLGHIGRDAKFHYIYLEQEIQGLYPRDDLYPADDLYPRDVKTSPIGKSVYKNCEYQDFITKSIDKLQIRKEENDIGVIVGSGNNAYVIEDNFLVYGKSTSDLEIIANNILKKIAGIRYRPFNANCIGNLLFDLGKPVRLVTKYEMIETYILSRTLTGIQQLSDSYSAKGTEYQQQKINSTSKSIKELKGKTNTLFRSVEETRLEIKDLDDNLSSKITQNAQKIELEVTRATTAENSLSSAIQVNANNIKLKVSKGSVSSEISQEAGQITIKSNRLVVESSQFKLDASGNATFGGTLSAANGSFSGKVDATEGSFQNVTVYGNCTVAGESISGSIGASKTASWEGNTIADAKIASSLSGKSFSGCTIPSGNNLGFGGSQISSGATISMISSSAIHMKTSNGANTVFSALQDNITISNLTVAGSKSRVVNTTFGNICLDAYETPTPMFGDIGEGCIDEDGQIYIFIDEEFYESIEAGYKYKVFLTPYGPGQLYVDMKASNSTFFIVKGSPGLEFAWEIKALQKDMQNTRFRKIDYRNFEESNTFEYDADSILQDIEQEAMNYV